jgi:hypothetical protein
VKVALLILLVVGAVAFIRAGIVGESPLAFVTRLVKPGSAGA